MRKKAANGARGTFKSFDTEATAVLEVTKLLEDHAVSREAAKLAHDARAEVPCWYCSFSVKLSEAVYVIGEGSSEMFALHRACIDSCTQALAEVPRGFEDRPIHGYIPTPPGLTPDDVQRLNKIAELANGPHAKVVAPIITKYFPMLVPPEGQPS